MKSNQLNAIALLLLATAGISAENTGWIQTAKNAATSTMKTVKDTSSSVMTSIKGNMPEASLKNAGIGALVVAVPTAAVAGYKRFLENEAVVLASQEPTKENILAWNNALTKKNYTQEDVKDAFGTVKSNLSALSRGIIIKDARINLDNACWKSGHKLQYALRKCYYNPVKTAAAIVGLVGAGYAAHHYGLDTKTVNGLNNGASAFYNALPAKPTWLAMPAFVSNMFAKKVTEKVAEEAVEKVAEKAIEEVAKAKGELLFRQGKNWIPVDKVSKQGMYKQDGKTFNQPFAIN